MHIPSLKDSIPDAFAWQALLRRLDRLDEIRLDESRLDESRIDAGCRS